MKHFGYLAFLITLLFCSCNRSNHPDLEVDLPINSVFIPVSIQINKKDLDEAKREELTNLVNNNHIINDASELPNDPFGQDEAFYHIDYSEQTLLIMYLLKTWTFDTYDNRYYINTQENSYNWLVKLGMVSDFDDDTEFFELTRFAILVRKLPINANVQTWYSLTKNGM